VGTFYLALMAMYSRHCKPRFSFRRSDRSREPFRTVVISRYVLALESMVHGAITSRRVGIRSLARETFELYQEG